MGVISHLNGTNGYEYQEANQNLNALKNELDEALVANEELAERNEELEEDLEEFADANEGYDQANAAHLNEKKQLNDQIAFYKQCNTSSLDQVNQLVGEKYQLEKEKHELLSIINSMKQQNTTQGYGKVKNRYSGIKHPTTPC